MARYVTSPTRRAVVDRSSGVKRHAPATPTGNASTNNSRRSSDIAPSNGRLSAPRIAYAVGAGDSEPRPALRQPLNHSVNNVQGRLGNAGKSANAGSLP